LVLEISIFNELINYLIERGYPPSSIVMDWPVGKYRVDLAIIDPESKEPMAIFEVKEHKNSSTMQSGYHQLRKYIKAMGNKSVLTYLVFSVEGEKPFQIKKVDIYNTYSQFEDYAEILSDIISFNILQNSRLNSIIAEKKNERDRVSLWVWGLSWALAIIIAILLVMDLLGFIMIETNHLILLAGIVALVMFPFIKRLRITDFEFEMLLTKRKE